MKIKPENNAGDELIEISLEHSEINSSPIIKHLLNEVN